MGNGTRPAQPRVREKRRPRIGRRNLPHAERRVARPRQFLRWNFDSGTGVLPVCFDSHGRDARATVFDVRTALQSLPKHIHSPTRRRNRSGAANKNIAHDHLRRMSDAFAPPKPNELVSAYSTFASVGWRTEGNVHAGSSVCSVAVGGSHCSRSAIRQITASTDPAAPSRWPMLALVELTGIFFACAPAQRLIAFASSM